MTQPENTIASVPQSVADENSVKAANDSIRDTLRRQSGRDQESQQEQQGTAVGEQQEEAAPRKRTTAVTRDDADQK